MILKFRNHKIESRLKALEGIKQEEWNKLKIVVDNRFYDIKNENRLIISQDTLDELKDIL